MTQDVAAVRPPFRLAAGGAGARVEWATWGLLAVAGVFAAVAADDLAYVLRVRAALPSPDLHVLVAGQGLGTAQMVLFFVLLAAVFGWYLLGAAAVRELGEEPATVLRTTALTVFQVGAAATLVAGATLPHADLLAAHGFEVRLRWMIPILVARLALAVLLGVAVFGVRRRVYAALLRSRLAPRRSRSQERASLLELSKRAVPVVPPLPVAGDAWWSEVAGRVAAAGTALPLLERSGGERRWHRVGPGEDLTALRESLPPGATLTLFATEPADPDATGAGTDDFDDPDALTAVVR
ncbi:hypothetical protein ACQEVZ_12855 [Dactylosporangium sp. CA-152071]|uniref:hypothetical protein n=1 Tax=Dactylosporangium sp. CA-152071 TaxID=3239933 RepID=UPI003D8B7A8A